MINDLYYVRLTCVLLIGISLILHFALVIVKVDRNGDISYHLVILPAMISFLIIGLWTGFNFFVFLIKEKVLYKSLESLAMSNLSFGSALTYRLLADKFEARSKATTLSALIPFMISSIITCLLLFISMITKNLKFVKSR